LLVCTINTTKMIYNTLAFALGLISANALLYTQDTVTQDYMWNSFKQEYNKKYSAEEEAHRFQIFLENMKIADKRNEAELSHGGSATHGITRFSDLTQEEFQTHYLASKINKNKNSTDLKTVIDHVEYEGGATSKDWAGVLTTPVKDQGYCGSCWAFSATEQLESDAMRVLKTSYILSVEQTTQCTNYLIGGGCNGGYTESAYKYIKSAGGLVQDSDYPYTKTTYEGYTGACTVNLSKAVVSLTGYTQITGESNMANYVLSTGPLSVCVAAEVWNSYTGGILSTCPGGVDHCVQAVGVDTSTINGYWKVRNSWGTRWGEGGYIRISYGSNTCQITDDPTYVAPILA